MIIFLKSLEISKFAEVHFYEGAAIRYFDFVRLLVKLNYKRISKF